MIDSRKRRAPQREADELESGEASQNASLFEERARTKARAPSVGVQSRLTAAQLHALEDQREKEVIKGYKRIEELWPYILSSSSGDGRQEEAEREWMLEAEKLVETFRETRSLFSTGKVKTLFLSLFFFLKIVFNLGRLF